MERKWLIATPILIVILVVCALMAAIVFFTLRDVALWDVWNLFAFDGLPIGTVSVEANEEMAYSVGSGSELVVENPCGKVDVRAAEGAQGINVSVHKQVWAQNEEQGARELAALQINASETPNRLVLGVDNEGDACRTRRGRQFAMVDFSIEVPAEMDVTVRSLSGDVLLSGVNGAADMRSEFGRITVTDTSGLLSVESVNGQVSLRSVDAGDGNIYVKSGFGSLQAEDIQAGVLEMTTTNGGVVVEEAVISRMVNLASDFGGITWNGGQAQGLDSRTQNGRIELSDLQISGDVVATSDFGGVSVQEVQAARIDAVTKNGRINIDGSTGPVTAQSNFGDIVVTGVEPVLINLSTESGGITFDGSLGDGENRLLTKFGSILLRLPADSEFTFDLQTNFGKITSEFDMTVSGAPSEKHLQGTVGEGGPSLVAETDNGNITLEAR